VNHSDSIACETEPSSFRFCSETSLLSHLLLSASPSVPRNIISFDLFIVFLWYLSRGGEGSSTSPTMHAGDYFPVIPTARFRKMNGLTLVSRGRCGSAIRFTAAAPPTLLLRQHQVAFPFLRLFAWLFDLDCGVSVLFCVPSTMCLFILVCSSFPRLFQASAHRSRRIQAGIR
jgi:hypothetical protein